MRAVLSPEAPTARRRAAQPPLYGAARHPHPAASRSAASARGGYRACLGVFSLKLAAGPSNEPGPAALFPSLPAVAPTRLHNGIKP
jgi:hypothetical protein